MDHSPEADDRDRHSPDWEMPPEPPIHRAARRGDVAEMARLLAAGASLEERADLEFDNGAYLKGLTALMVAARSINGATVDSLRWMVERGASIRARSAGGVTAAWYAAGDGGRWEFHRRAVTPDHTDRLRLLLDLGADPNEVDRIGRSLLVEACSAGDPSRVRLLLERGARAAPDNPLATGPRVWEAIEQRKRLLIDGSASPIAGEGLRSARGSLMSFAIPIFCAAASGSAECVSLLLDRGVDPNERDDGGRTPLMGAGSPEAVRALLARGASLEALDDSERDALDHALEQDCEGPSCPAVRARVALALVEAGAPVERTDSRGWSRLRRIAFHRNANSVDVLLSLGVSAGRVDDDGNTALHGICWHGEYTDPATNEACARIIASLLAAGADVGARDADGDTPLHLAAHGDWGNVTAVRSLVAAGAEVDARNGRGETALHLAAERGEEQCIRALLDAGADPLARDRSGATPMDAAMAHRANWVSICGGPEDEETARYLRASRQAEQEVYAEQGMEGFALEEPDPETERAETAKRHSEAMEEAERCVAVLEEAVKRRAGESGR